MADDELKFLSSGFSPLMAGVFMLSASLGTQAADLAIVIDDIGHNYQRDRLLTELPAPITLSMLPFAPDSKRLARLAASNGHEVMLHQPMQYRAGIHNDEPGTLRADMPAAQFTALFNEALRQLPHCAGVNNHTGSFLTAQAKPMNLVMSQLSLAGLFFLDSRTTHKTVALNVARHWSVPSIKRDVFLDHDTSPGAIHHEFRRALRIARTQGYAVVIGHPNRNTINYLQRVLGDLPGDIRLQRVSSLIDDRTDNVPMPLLVVENTIQPSGEALGQ